jgi:hypothetical protein
MSHQLFDFFVSFLRKLLALLCTLRHLYAILLFKDIYSAIIGNEVTGRVARAAVPEIRRIFFQNHVCARHNPAFTSFYHKVFRVYFTLYICMDYCAFGKPPGKFFGKKNKAAAGHLFLLFGNIVLCVTNPPYRCGNLETHY